MYAEVLLPIKIGTSQKSLTYNIPQNMMDEVSIGSAVKVSVRNKIHTGIVKELHERSLHFAVKDILSTKEGAQILQPWQTKLAEWISHTYHAPLYKALKMMLPKKLWQPKSKIP